MLPDLPAVRCGQGFDLLSDVRVLDLTTSIAGPYATMQLADWGAQVIKVERPGRGDDTRYWGPPFLDGDSLWFLSVNRNKQSVTLDYSQERGYAVLLALLRECDVVVTNQVPRVQSKLKTDYESLSAVKPDLIYLALTGFGLTGERKEMVCYDLIAEGHSGIMDLTGEAENDPQKVGTPAADMLAGTDTAFAAVAALYDHQRTGKGRKIDVTLTESMTRFLTSQIVSYMGSGQVPRRSGAKESVLAVYQTFHASDAPVTLAVGNDTLWSRFCTAVDRLDLAGDERFETNADRRQHRQELVEEIQGILDREPRDHWLRLFAEHKVPAGPINRVDEVVADRALIERGLFYRIEREGGSSVPQVNSGTHVDGQFNVPRRLPPGLGEDTGAVLQEVARLSEDEILALRDDGIV